MSWTFSLLWWSIYTCRCFCFDSERRKQWLGKEMRLTGWVFEADVQFICRRFSWLSNVCCNRRSCWFGDKSGCFQSVSSSASISRMIQTQVGLRWKSTTVQQFLQNTTSCKRILGASFLRSVLRYSKYNWTAYYYWWHHSHLLCECFYSLVFIYWTIQLQGDSVLTLLPRTSLITPNYTPQHHTMGLDTMLTAYWILMHHCWVQGRK